MITFLECFVDFSGSEFYKITLVQGANFKNIMNFLSTVFNNFFKINFINSDFKCINFKIIKKYYKTNIIKSNYAVKNVLA